MLETINYTEHAADVLAVATREIKAGRPIALIASLEIKGGSARACGSLALVDETGTMHGYLSNGCIDRDIQLQAREALASGDKRVLLYGAGSKYLDLKLPCGGSLSVLIDPAPDTDALLAAADDLLARRPAELTFDPPVGGDHGLSRKIFRYDPKFRLCLAGRGAVFRAVVEAANASGFEVEALSPDQEDLDAAAAFTIHPPHHITMSGSVPQLAALDQNSAFLTLFHDHDWEAPLLQEALKTPVRFIGCMGSNRTHLARLGTLASLGVPEDQLDRVRGPLGLVGSLRHAQLVAISALAEVAALRPNAIVEVPVEEALKDAG